MRWLLNVLLVVVAILLESIRAPFRRLFGLRTVASWTVRHEVPFGVMRRMAYWGVGSVPGKFQNTLPELPTALLPGGIELTRTVLGGRPAEIQTPPGWNGTDVVLYLHGGGYVFGSPGTHRHIIAGLALRTQYRLVALDYRLAPQDPYPAALLDARAAWDELRKEHEPSQIAIAGDSAGGGLSMALALNLRDDGEPPPRCLGLMSPWVDLTMSGPSHALASAYDYLPTPLLHRFAAAYAGAIDPADPRISPLHADLAGLPPMLVQAGGREALCWEAEELVRRAKAAGVDARADVAEDMIHVYQAFVDLVPEARDGLRRLAAFLRHTRPDADDPWAP